MSQRNILIRQDGTTVVADFGYSRLLHGERRKDTTPESVIRTYRYLAPEVIAPNAVFLPSPETDTYALAMTIVELGTGARPFREIENGLHLLDRVIEPESYRPPKEKSLGYLGEEHTKELWKYLEGMWCHRPDDRHDVAIVLQYVEMLYQKFLESAPGQQVRVRAMQGVGPELINFTDRPNYFSGNRRSSLPNTASIIRQNNKKPVDGTRL